MPALDTPRTRFPDWYQEAVRKGDLAVNSPVRGCMIIRPNGVGLWQQIQRQLNDRIEATGHDNLYFPLFIPLSFLAEEAAHVDGFAKETAVVTHHRLKMIDGVLGVDPEAELTEPLIVRPTSETIIGHHFAESVQTYRDLPLLWNQWANVVRWEMRTRLFLRTTEFLWQEGHTCHADQAGAEEETFRMLEVYREFVENVLAMPVMVGEKPAHERFAGATNTYSIEAMMQDGKALQAATSHYLGTNFAKAQKIYFQSSAGVKELCHTTSWGASTRLIGGVVMMHGDDDGLRLPPFAAPRQIVIVPMLRNKPEDAAVLEFCEELRVRLAAGFVNGDRLRASVDVRHEAGPQKRWGWVRKGAPIICEIGPRDAASRTISFLRRDQLYKDGSDKANVQALPMDDFVGAVPGILEDIQKTLYREARAKLDANITDSVRTVGDLRAYFPAGDAEDSETMRGWARCAWSRPEGEELKEVEAELKRLKITIRNSPLNQGPSSAKCVFTGKPAVEDVYIARSY